VNPTISRPSYSCEPIRSVGALSKALGVSKELVLEQAECASSRYRLAKPIVKPDGSIRQPFDALHPLKGIHGKIKTAIFYKVVFPLYLTGSLRGRNYRVNAALHAGAKIVICEDIEGFFPATSAALVRQIWQQVFKFPDEVANLLTLLTTKDGFLPQGAITSSYLANLAFWKDEPILQAKMAEKGITYSRYVDDVTISSKTFLSNEQQSEAIARVYGMLAKAGYRAKRRKHEVFTDKRPMFTTKLMMNKRPALKPDERSNIRTAVFQLECRASSGERGAELEKMLNKVTGRVGKLVTFHVNEGAALMKRVKRVREILSA
jgi:hypothetical protein